MGPLQHLKVLDLTRLLPGPYATLVLADLGAQVDKVEEPHGDYARHMPPIRDDVSALFLGLNRNKRSLVLDLKSAEGVAQFKKLVPAYDVVIESFRPGVMERLGVGYEVLKSLHPGLIYCGISGYGATGPDSKKAGHDLNYIARAGVLGYGGSAEGPPTMPGVQMADIGGSLFSVIGILAALEQRRHTGLGQFVDISMTDCATAFLHLHLASRLQMGDAGHPLQRGREALNGGYPCYGVYETADKKYLSVASLEPQFFSRLLGVLGRPELMDGAYDTGALGQQTRGALEGIFGQKSLAEWIAQLQGHDVCVEPILEGDEVLGDAQLKVRGLFQEGPAGRIFMLTPVRFHAVQIQEAPTLGEHTEVVLRENGIVQ
jgi:alpha-methylacyl-CoA racemase